MSLFVSETFNRSTKSTPQQDLPQAKRPSGLTTPVLHVFSPLGLHPHILALLTRFSHLTPRLQLAWPSHGIGLPLRRVVIQDTDGLIAVTRLPQILGSLSNRIKSWPIEFHHTHCSRVQHSFKGCKRYPRGVLCRSCLIMVSVGVYTELNSPVSHIYHARETRGPPSRGTSSSGNR
jgi:hypothetical protein